MNLNLELIVSLVIMLAKSGVVLGTVLGLVAYSVVAERRFCAFIQDRVGPNRTGIPLTNIRLFGLGQPMADGMKFLFKEEYTPNGVRIIYFWLAPLLAMVPALMTVAAVPFGSMLDLRPVYDLALKLVDLSWIPNLTELRHLFYIPAVIADVDVGILYVFAIVSISVYGIVLAGWSSNSKYPFLGGIRSSAQLISYELSMGLAVVPIFLVIGQLNLSEIVHYQAQNGWLAFPVAVAGAEFNWKSFVYWIPLALSFFISLIAAFAETNRLPFDMPECETELVGGYHTEYSAMKFALFFLGEYAAMIVVSCMMVTLFLGGWSLPLPGFDGTIPSALPIVGDLNGFLPLVFQLMHIGVFLGKMAMFIFLFIWVRWTLPRFRYDQLMSLGWKFFIPLALANVVLTALLVAWVESPRSCIRFIIPS